jgi:hypothetical protein
MRHRHHEHYPDDAPDQRLAAHFRRSCTVRASGVAKGARRFREHSRSGGRAPAPSRKDLNSLTDLGTLNSLEACTLLRMQESCGNHHSRRAA